MAHEVETMMYVGKLPWHGLGNKLDSQATAKEAIVASGLDWKVKKERLVWENWETNKYVLYRETDRKFLGIVGDLYIPCQNQDAFRFLDAVTQDPRGPKYETAGSLYGGRVVWILAKLPEQLHTAPDDVIDQYLLFTNRHDGQQTMQMWWTPVRVVCANTLSIAFSKTTRRWRLKHVYNINEYVTSAQDCLGIARENALAMTEIAQALLSVWPTTEQINAILQQLIPGEATRSTNAREDICHLFGGGQGQDNPAVRGTGWALYNALTEFADHKKVIKNANVADNRMRNLVWGKGAEFKGKALDACLTLVK